jgi:hypothetical protein
MSATALHRHIRELQAERVMASLHGLASDPAYMADLDDEIDAARHAYIGAAVIEIASLRAELSGAALLG